MSIYREMRYRPADVYAVRIAQEAQRDHDEDRYLKMRRSAPAETLLPGTSAWATRLPSELKPRALLDRYPRVANLVAATWADARAFETYIESLLTDKRGNRRGFPVEVQRELASLALAHSKVPSSSRRV
jgi:hypothetical protein